MLVRGSKDEWYRNWYYADGSTEYADVVLAVPDDVWNRYEKARKAFEASLAEIDGLVEIAKQQYWEK